ncbi:MAG: RluA family pseudouridine synthase [Deltaproteobacteria bacterium]|nr:RluA family pseudouridine synthase [Deltaproteobacteria bacterium]
MSKRTEFLAGVSGERLDRLITRSVADVSRRRVRALIEAGSVFVEGKRCRIASRTIELGARVVVFTEPAVELSDPVVILYEDEDLVVVDKACGEHVNETETTSRISLVQRLERLRGPVFVVHRLDRETTGVIVFARRLDVAAELSRAFAEREVGKSYLLLTELAPPEGIVSAPIADDPRRPRARRVASTGQEAETEFHVAARTSDVSLVVARPRTGRTHQIRVHLAHLGAPVLGDRLYGGVSAIRVRCGSAPGDTEAASISRVLEVPRVMLHARRIQFTFRGTERTHESPVPMDFAPFLELGLALPTD